MSLICHLIEPELETLLQEASNNYAYRLEALRHAVRLAAQAAAMGPGAVRALASELHYSVNIANKLAAMGQLPEELISVDMKVGAYWTAIIHAEEVGLAPLEAVKWALKNEAFTPAKVKEMLGVEAGKHDPPLLDEAMPSQSLAFPESKNWPDIVRVIVREIDSV